MSKDNDYGPREWFAPIFSFIIFCILVVGVLIYFQHKKDISDPVLASDSNSSCISAADSWNNIGKNECVNFHVGYTYVSSKGNAYLDEKTDYSSGFSVWIPSGYSFGTSMTQQYDNQDVTVSGTIREYNGAPEIEVTDPSQVVSNN